jgi:hypothetical protein
MVKSYIKKRENKRNKSYSWIFFDYSCVPQDDQVEKSKYFESIPALMKKCQVSSFHANAALQSAYENSVWCQLEHLGVAVGEHLNLTGHENRIWTITNMDDLYLLLPGCLEMVRFSYDFFC